MTTVTKSLTIDPAAANELTAAAQADGTSVSRLFVLALEDAIAEGLSPDLEPLSAGSKTLAPRLDPELVAAAEAKAAEAGLSFSAFARTALAQYLALDEDADADDEDDLEPVEDEDDPEGAELDDDEDEEPVELGREKIAGLLLGVGLLAFFWFAEPSPAHVKA